MELQEAQGSKSLLGSCHMCGKCCEAIHIPYSPEEIKQRYDTQRKWEDSDFVFVHENWTPIPKEEAFGINPHFAEMERRGVDYSRMHFYTCKNYDKENHNCSIYDKRPRICSGYPWYGSAPNPIETFYNMDCGYRVDTQDTWAYKEDTTDGDTGA